METIIIWVAIVFVGGCIFLMARTDWPRLRGDSRSVTAEVVGHRSLYHDGGRSYAPIYHFLADDAQHEVIDQVYVGTQQPQAPASYCTIRLAVQILPARPDR